MAAQPPAVAASRFRWAFWGVLLLLALGVALALLLLARGRDSSSPGAIPAADAPSAAWAAGAVRAPGFRLADQNGTPFSLASLRGRPVLVTFIDPLCRNYCPIEAQRLTAAVRSLPAASRPAIVAVSVNVYGNARANLLQDARKWRLGPEWRWGIGDGAQLSPVWARYHVGVFVTKKKIAGVTVNDVAHTEAAYLVDRSGYERALFLWPYRAEAVARAVTALR